MATVPNPFPWVTGSHVRCKMASCFYGILIGSNMTY